jgi:hypothetical protein
MACRWLFGLASPIFFVQRRRSIAIPAAWLRAFLAVSVVFFLEKKPPAPAKSRSPIGFHFHSAAHALAMENTARGSDGSGNEGAAMSAFLWWLRACGGTEQDRRNHKKKPKWLARIATNSAVL